MKKALVAAFIAGGVSSAIGQTKLDAVVRPRYEYRDGFANPSQDRQVGANWVQQRTRITLTSKVKGVELKVSPQDIRVWGAVPTLNANDNFNSLYEGWMKFNLDSAGLWSMKLGRQELNYDDARILGNVDWAQQGRSHDAGLLRYKKGSSKLDVAVVYNQNGPNNVGNQYTLAGQTKGLQVIHFNTEVSGAKASFLAMNNLFQDPGGNTVHAMFTGGTYWKFGNKESKMVGEAAAYFQAGTLASGTATQGFLASANILYKTPKTKVGLGAEIISGTDMDDTSGDNASFNPIYGTNHKFNGLMDYFYVGGRHGGSVGLIDINGKVIHPFSKKFKAIAMVHQFNAAANVIDSSAEDASRNLGQEVDLVFKYKINDNVKLAAGYSQYFATESLGFVRGLADTDNINHWGWVMISGNISKILSEK